jgi:hypothetical protein
MTTLDDHPKPDYYIFMIFTSFNKEIFKGCIVIKLIFYLFS